MDQQHSRALSALINDCSRRPRISEERIAELLRPHVEFERQWHRPAPLPPRPPEAVNPVVEGNMRLAVHMAMRATRRRSDALDLIQAASLGLMRAAQKFDPDRGTKFSSYAGWWVKAGMRIWKQRTFSIVDLGAGRKYRDLLSKLYAITSMPGGEEMDREALAAATGATPADIDRVLATSRGDLSLDAPLDFGDPHPFARTYTVGDRFTDDEDPELACNAGVLRGDLRELMAVYRRQLRRDLEREVFDARIANDVETLADVGRRVGVSRERVRQLEVKMLQGMVEMGRDFWDVDVDEAGAA